MKEYISVRHTSSNKTTVKVTLIDGDLSSSYEAVTYIGEVGKATVVARKNAARSMQEVRDVLEADTP